MGLSVSAGTAVLLVGAFLMLGVIVPGTLNAHDRVTTAEDLREQLQTDRQQTDIAIASVVSDNGSLTVTVNNTGTTALDLSETDVLVDNAYVGTDNVTVEAANGTETKLWLPDETATFNLSTDGSESVLVVTEYGIDARTPLEGDV